LDRSLLGAAPGAMANLRETARLTGPYQVWVTDIAYGHIRSGLVYAAGSLTPGRVRWLVTPRRCRSPIGYRASRCTPLFARTGRRRGAFTTRLVGRSTSRAAIASCCGNMAYSFSWEASMGRAIFASHDRSQEAPSRHIVDIQDYGTWKDVIDHPREFIQALYSPERVEAIVGDGL